MSISRLPFEEVFTDESGGNIKTPQSEYKAKGSFPIVDQGKSLICGYTDDVKRICGGGRPAIIFGDHTRCVKFMNTPFCMGADGVKVLRPKIDADLKYLYYYLRQLRLPDAGYDRHFKYLKRTEVVIHPLSEQRRIAAILDKADAFRAKRKEALAQLDRLAQSVFVGMMLESESQVTRIPIEQCMAAIIDYRGKTPEKTDSGVPLVTARVVKGGELLEPSEFIAQDDYDAWMRRGLPQEGDVLFTTEAPLGEVAQLDGRKVALAQRLLLLRGKKELLDNKFLMFALTSTEVRKQINARASGSTVKGIRQSELRKVVLPIPPLETQKEFNQKIGSIQRLRAYQRLSLARLDELFESLQNRAFRGEL